MEQACVTSNEPPASILSAMKASDVRPNALSYEHLITYYTNSFNLEHAFFLLDEASAARIKPSLESLEAVILCAANPRIKQPRLAWQMCRDAESAAGRTLRPATLLAVLESCATSHEVRCFIPPKQTFT